MDDGGRSPSPGLVRRLADSIEDIPYYHVESGTVPLSYPFDYLSRTGMEGVTSRAGGRQGEQRGREGRPRGWTRRYAGRTCRTGRARRHTGAHSARRRPRARRARACRARRARRARHARALGSVKAAFSAR